MKGQEGYCWEKTAHLLLTIKQRQQKSLKEISFAYSPQACMWPLAVQALKCGRGNLLRSVCDLVTPCGWSEELLERGLDCWEIWRKRKEAISSYAACGPPTSVSCRTGCSCFPTTMMAVGLPSFLFHLSCKQVSRRFVNSLVQSNARPSGFLCFPGRDGSAHPFLIRYSFPPPMAKHPPAGIPATSKGKTVPWLPSTLGGPAGGSGTSSPLQECRESASPLNPTMLLMC